MSIINKNLLKKFECRFFKFSLVSLFLIFIFGYSPILKKAYAINIYTIEDLDSIRNDLSGSHVLMNDLDFNSDASYSDPANKIAYTTGEGWDPVGVNVSGSWFSGTFDGNGYTISNLYINNTTDKYVGLFGVVFYSTISNTGVVNANITSTSYAGILVSYVTSSGAIIESTYSTGSVSGFNNVGGLIGWNNGTITNSYSTSSVTSFGDNAGGLIGANIGTTTNSYSTGSVNGFTSVGGLVGSNYGIIEDSYSQGSVSGTINWVGGLVGDNISSGSVINTYSTGSVNCSGIVGGLISANNGFVSDSYWDTETSGMGTSDGGIGKTTLEMHAIATFTNWDMVDISSFDPYNPNDWYIDEGLDYPRLFWESADYPPPPPEVDYTIDSIEDLNNIRYDLAGDYVLTTDLDFNSDASYSDPANKIAYTTGEGWDPIGLWFASGSWFSGTFDGNGYTISNLYINNTTDEQVGLFGATYDSTISDIGIIDAVVTTTSQTYFTGILVGIAEENSVIEDSYSTGSVTGRDSVGGLVGVNDGGSIYNSYSTGSVTGRYAVGGLFGVNDGGSIYNSYSTGSVTGRYAVGGLVGDNYGTINNSYSTASVTSSGEGAGGLVGENDGSIYNSYSTGSVSGILEVGGLVGDNWNSPSNAIITNSYSIGFVSGGTNPGGLVGNSNDGAVITDSFWDTETSGMDVSDGGTGKTTEEMMLMSTFYDTETEGLDTPWDIIEIENFDLEDPAIWYIEETNDYPRLFWEFEGYTPPDDPDDSNNKTVFHPDRRCHWKKPSEPTWIRLAPATEDGVSGMLLTWTQYDADKINIKIDDGTGNYPWKIEKISNDGHEFLPNVSSWQNIMIKPINHCKEGEYSLAVSQLAYPYGWYGQSGNKAILANNTLGYSTKSAVLGTSTESVETPLEETPMVPETGSSDILYLTTSLSIIGFSIYFVLNEKSRRFALRDFERRVSRGL